MTERSADDQSAVTDSNAMTVGSRDATTERGTIPDRTAAGESDGFLPKDQMDSLREQWNDLQTAFVDDPRVAVQRAHTLVTELVDELTGSFARDRAALEVQWKGGGNADTEALRVALQRYRTFFERLLR